MIKKSVKLTKKQKAGIKRELPKMIAKASELGFSPLRSTADLDKPQFVYVKLGNCWGPWKRKGGSGNGGGFELEWGAKGIGFGVLTFYIKNKKAYCSTECMGKAFVSAAMSHFLATQVVYED